MSTAYRIYGSEMSPYSLKVRGYCRYKGIPHEWIIRSGARMEEFQRYAKLPLIPLVVTPDDRGMQDSTPIIEMLEAAHPEPSVHPPDPGLRFLSELIEEYADEWANKHMFHYRWWYEPDQRSAAARIARDVRPELEGKEHEQAAHAIRTHMIPRISFVGSSAQTQEAIEESFERLLAILEAHLAARPYLFGGRPALADFGLAAQLHQCGTDPTPGARMRDVAPRVVGWTERLLDPTSEGLFEESTAILPTLRPLLAEEIGSLFLPWSEANAKAIAAGAEEMTVELRGRAWIQKPQKYHAKSLAALRTKYAALTDRAGIEAVLRETGCTPVLAA